MADKTPEDLLSEIVVAVRARRKAKAYAGPNDVIARFIMHAPSNMRNHGRSHTIGSLNTVSTMAPLFDEGVVDPLLTSAAFTVWALLDGRPVFDDAERLVRALTADIEATAEDDADGDADV